MFGLWLREPASGAPITDNANLFLEHTGGPGASIGGMRWASASDGFMLIYGAIANSDHLPTPLVSLTGRK